MTAVDNHGYAYVEAWGRYMDSSPNYIQEQCDRAQAGKAPLNATYEEYDSPGTWRTTDDITSESARRFLELDPLSPAAPAALRNYHGTVISEGEGVFWIEFPDMPAAAGWSRQYEITARVSLRDPERRYRFDHSVVVELQPG